MYHYQYDPWNRLVKVRAKLDAVTIQTAEYDRTGRLARKAVTNAGEFDGTELYYYETVWPLAQVNDGAGNMVKQFLNGTHDGEEMVTLRERGYRPARRLLRRESAGMTRSEKRRPPPFPARIRAISLIYGLEDRWLLFTYSARERNWGSG